MAVPLKVIQVQKAPSVTKAVDPFDLLTALCYHYPQYSLDQARMLPYRRVVKLLKTAEQMQAQKYYNLTQIAAAPHTKNGEGVKQLSQHFEALMNG